MNYLETIKNMAKNKERRVQNLILIVVLLVIILLCANFLFSSSDKKDDTSNSTGQNTNINDNSSTANISKTSNDSLESKLSNILSQISGISNVSVVLTYSQDTKQNPIYNTKESEKSGEKTTEKNVAYNEEGSSKTAIIETVEMPKIEGAIIVAKGANSLEIRSRIATAISTVTNVPVYKVQVFEKNG